MADGIVGVAVTEPFRTGIEGQTLTLDTDATTKPDGTAWTPTITNDPAGSDTWVVTFTPDQAGIFVFETDDADGNRYRGEYHVVAAPSTTFSRVTAGQRLRSAHINQLQQRLEELPY